MSLAPFSESFRKNGILGTLEAVNAMNPDRDGEVKPEAGIFAFVHLFVLMLLTLAFTSILPSSVNETGMSASRMLEVGLLAGATLVAVFVGFGRMFHALGSTRSLFTIMTLFCIWAGMTAAWSPSAMLALGKSGELALLTLAAALIGAGGATVLPSPKSLPSLTALALAGATGLLLVLSFLSPSTPVGLVGISYEQRLFLGHTHPLTVADLLALALISLLASRIWAKAKVVYFLCIGALFALTQPRGALGGLIAGFAAMILVRIERRSVQVAICISGFLIAAMVLLYSGPDLPRVIDTYTPADFGTLNGRTEVWEYSLSLIRDRPWNGYGYYSSRFLLLRQFPWAGHAHNAYLEMLLTTGVIGLALCLALVVHAGSLALRTRNVWLAGVIAYCASVSMLDPLLMTPGIPMLVTMLACAHAATLERQNEEDPAVSLESAPGADGAIEHPAAIRGQ